MHAKNDDRGLRCSACGEPRLRVIYTRPKPGARIVRRRECVACGQRITTWERTAGQVQMRNDSGGGPAADGTAMQRSPIIK